MGGNLNACDFNGDSRGAQLLPRLYPRDYQRKETMITREEIRSIPELHKSIQRDKERLRYLREKATSIPSLSDQERVQTSPSGGGNRFVEAAVDLNNEIRAKEIRLTELQGRAKKFICSLPAETEVQKLTLKVLKYRYLRCYTWEEISEVVVYAPRYIQQLEWEIVKDLIPPHGVSSI